MSLINEAMVALYLYFLLALTQSDDEFLGFALLGIVVFSYFINTVKTVVLFIIKYRLHKMQIRRAKVYSLKIP